MARVTKAAVLQGTLDLIVLKALAGEPMHGWGIANRVRQLSKEVFRIGQGSLYPALHRLENKGFLAAEWKESETGREAKFYKLTRKGQAQLKEETAHWARLSEAVGLILQLSQGGAL